MLNAMPMTWAEDATAKMNVTFAYRYYKSIYYRRDQPGLGFGFSVKIGKDGISGNLRLPKLGSISVGDGLAEIKNKIATIRNF
jgi:hypothetical protein